MVEELTVCTISKYPPYMAGHSFEALYQGKALWEQTGRRHVELTYDASVYDPTSNYNSSSELMYEAERYVDVHRVRVYGGQNLKVFDGALIKAFVGRAIELITEKGVNVFSTFYLDPHALIANEAKAYAERVLGKRILTAHKAVGSDVLNSIANHLTDGEGKFILLQLLLGDLQFAVSEYTKKKLLEYATLLLPKQTVETMASNIQVLYAPFDNSYFAQRDEGELSNFRRKYRIPKEARVVSYFGRLFPEKGVEDLLSAFSIIKAAHPTTILLIGGQGVQSDALKLQAQTSGIQDVVFTGALSNTEKRALMQLSEVAAIPTKPVLNFVETLCISALEFQAAGAPLITTRVGGVPEAAGPHSLYAEHSSPQNLAENINRVLEDKALRRGMIAAGLLHVQQFNYSTITQTFLRHIERCRS